MVSCTFLSVVMGEIWHSSLYIVEAYLMSWCIFPSVPFLVRLFIIFAGICWASLTLIGGQIGQCDIHASLSNAGDA